MKINPITGQPAEGDPAACRHLLRSYTPGGLGNWYCIRCGLIRDEEFRQTEIAFSTLHEAEHKWTSQYLIPMQKHGQKPKK